MHSSKWGGRDDYFLCQKSVNQLSAANLLVVKVGRGFS